DPHVAGNGSNAYLQLSGTSMAAGVVSGAVALLLQQRASLRPALAKAILELTSSFVASAGLIAGGSGAINALAASEFVAGGLNGVVGSTRIAGELVWANGFLIFAESAKDSIVWSGSI